MTNAQLPKAVTALQNGQRLSFGPIWLTATEVGSGEKSVPWAQIEEISIKEGWVQLKVAGRWRSLSTTAVSSIANFFVFHSLAEHLRRAHAGQSGYPSA